MKIGIDARFYRKSTGGIGRYTRALIRELALIDKNNDYYIFLTPADQKEFEVKEKNFHAITTPIGHYSFSEQTKFISILNNQKLDLVHFTHFNHPIFYKGKFVVTIHDLTMMLFPFGKQKNFLKREAFKMVVNDAVKRSEKIIAISESTKKDITNILHGNGSKIKVIYEGVDTEYKKIISSQFSALSSKYKIKKPYILFLSQWRPHKGLIELIKVFEILKKKYKIPHQLLVGGIPNPDFPEVINAIDQSENKKDIIAPGFIAEEDLPMIYTAAELFVFPSYYEGFGIPPLEAMACGVPVASSNTSCMPEILGNAAEYFDPKNTHKMAEVIYKLLTDKQGNKETRIKKGIEQVKKYSWKKMAKETLELYQSLSKN